jgi:hypothetical protein
MRYNVALFSMIVSMWVPLRADVATLPSGSSIVVRTIDAIDSKSADVGRTFKASVDEPVIVNGKEVAGKGSDAVLKIVEAKTAGKLKGNAELSIMLVSVKSGDQILPIESDNVTMESAGKGKGSAIKIGGGTAVGGVLGGVLGGRKGAAIGAGAGAGAGTIVAVATGPHVKIPPETRLKFKVQ